MLNTIWCVNYVTNSILINIFIVKHLLVVGCCGLLMYSCLFYKIEFDSILIITNTYKLMFLLHKQFNIGKYSLHLMRATPDY